MRSPTVLLIDPDGDTLAIFSLILRHHGLEVIEASDARAGFELACDRRPDLVVLEPFLPAVDGRALPELLREDERTAGLSTLMVTAVPQMMETRRRADGPVAPYLVKPCHPRYFLSEVRRRLDAA